MFRNLPFVLLLALLCSGFAIHQAVAQTPDNPWTEPVNLSHSGSTTDPKMIIDSEGIIRIIWVDAYAGAVYTYGDGERWSTPRSISLPFDLQRSKLFSDANGQIHAFWIDERGAISYSSVKATDFDNPTQWLPVQSLDESVVSMDLNIDTHNILHLVYVRNSETAGSPAGVYYRRSTDAGREWSSPALLYQSPYFRGLTVDQANLEIITTESSSSTHIFVAWDNRPRKQVLLVRSQDSGHSWEAPVQIAKPGTDSEITNPFNIHVGAFGDKLLLIWQNGDPGARCTQFYQWSKDGGNTWGEYQQMIKDINGCAQENRILLTSNDLFLLESTIQGQVYMLAWNGEEWSLPQAQDVLTNFIDPETNNSVVYNCRQLITQKKQARLLAVGCDSGTSGNTGGTSQGVIRAGDIWFMSRPLGTMSDWFPKAPTWSPPAIIATSESKISSPILVADNNGQVYALWKQLSSGAVTANGANPNAIISIYTSRLDNGNWTQPSQVINFPAGETREPAFTVDSKSRLLAVWGSGEASASLNFSEMDPGPPTSPSDWTNTQQIPAPLLVGMTPSIITDKAGIIYVSYAVPFNEGRGIYLNKSGDNGKTWTPAMKVFDGAAAGWEMVGNPRLTMTSEGYLHLLWTQLTIPTGSGVQALYYIQSKDGGQTWSDIQTVTDTRAVWSDLLGTNEGIIHRVWQENNNGWSPIWDQYSQDNGATWSQATSISGVGESLGLVVLKVDSAGQFHLIQIASREDGLFELQHWVWSGNRWSKDEGQSLELNTVQNVTDLEATISPSGQLSVLYVGSIYDQRSNILQDNLFYAVHTVDILSESPKPTAVETPVIVETPLITETLAATPIPTQSMTPTNTLANEGINGSYGSSTPSSWTGVILGVGIVVVIIGLVLGIQILKLRSLRR